MSNLQTQAYIESLIEDLYELKGRWNGSDDGYEEKILEIENELEELGINIEELDKKAGA